MIDESSKAYQLWKGFYGISYFEEQQYGGKSLFYNDSHGSKCRVDNIAIKDFGAIQYLSWTEENGSTKLIIFELEPHRHRRLEWTIAPAKDTGFFWVNKWTEQGLFIIYNDSATNYALSVSISKKPRGLSLNVTELGVMLCIKRDWLIGYKFYTDKTVSLFNLKTFSYAGTLTEEESIQRNMIPVEQGENDEELE